MYSVYKLNFPNGKSYIGQTKKDPSVRFNQHKSNIKKDLKRPIIEAMRKFKDLVNIEILEINLSQNESDFLEKYYIKFYDSLIDNNGYNLSPGGNSGSIMSIEGKKRHKEKMKKHYNNPEYVKKITKHLVDRKLNDPDYYKKQKECVDVYFSKTENREKHSLVKGGQPFVCVETGEVFISQAIGGEKLKVHSQNIYKVLKNKRKSCGGFTFEYIKKGE
jgi:hypothetical protein